MRIYLLSLSLHDWNYLKCPIAGVIQNGMADAVIWKIPKHQFTSSTVRYVKTA
jgi:hypothetical protein